MLRHKIKLPTNGDDANINIQFQNETMLGGLSEDIDNLVLGEAVSSINDGLDDEIVRFKPFSGSYSMSVFFYRNTSSSYVNFVAPNEFASSAVTTTAFLNSFYVYKIYDSPSQDKQTLLHTGYLNGFNFKGYQSNSYPWNTNYEYSDIHISKSFLDTVTGTTFSIYMKLAFYSAKSGKVYPFARTQSMSNEEALYVRLTMNKTTRTYSSFNVVYQFYEITNPTWVNLVNDTVDSLEVTFPSYPTGNTFTNSGEYVTVA